MWQNRLAEYLTAKGRHDEADRLYHRACRTMEKLGRRIGYDRAYKIVGMALADERSLRAYAEQRRTLDKLMASLAGASTATRLGVAGRVKCADLPRAVNDR